MKMSPEFQQAYEKMKPGIITQTGFLGDDHRNLMDIITHDEEVMHKLHLDFDILVEKMRYFYKAGIKGLGEPITVDGHWLVRVDETRGKLPSPFQDGMFNKINIFVENKKIKQYLLYTEMSIHLIEKYHFFQGKGAPYRIEPHDCKAVFEL